MRQIKEPNFDPVEDLRQAGFRLEMLRYIAIAIFVILSGRLWYLQVMNKEVYAERAEQNRTRLLPIPAKRGDILDRKGRILVTSESSYNIVISREDAKQNFVEIADILVENLGIDRNFLNKRFEDAKYEAKYESIVVKDLATEQDVAWVEAHQFEYPMIRAEEAPRRLYLYGALAAHALGYVGEVGRGELIDPKSPFNKENGFKLGDIIGKGGIERTYNDVLAGLDGARKVLVDSRGRIQREIERIEPKQGRDLTTTLDLDIQRVAEKQADTMPAGRGVIVVENPQNGQILAYVSHPSFDPNVFSRRAKQEIRELYEDPDKPLYNRPIQGGYPPGSTWKLMTTVAALNEGIITPEKSNVFQDGGIQIGNYFMSSMSSLGRPDAVTAIAKSADGYFYRMGIEMGPERFEKWVRSFRFGQRTGIDLPREQSGLMPIPAVKLNITRNILKQQNAKRGVPWTEKDEERAKREGKFSDYDMAASAFGQGQNVTTPIQLLRYVGGLAVGGKMYTPHLFLEAEKGFDRKGVEHKKTVYEDKHAYVVPMSASTHKVVLNGMWQAVNGWGTAGGTKIDGFDVCGKTGTAQVASKDKAGKKSQDHAWFMTFAPRDKPELAMVILTENAGFGGTHSVPRAKAIYDDYCHRVHPKICPMPAPEDGKAAVTPSPTPASALAPPD